MITFNITFNNLTREQALQLIRVCDDIQQPKPLTEISQPAKESKRGGSGVPFTADEREVIASANSAGDAWHQYKEQFPEVMRTRGTINTQFYRLRKKSKEPPSEPKPEPQQENQPNNSFEDLAPPLKAGSKVMIMSVTGKQAGAAIHSYQAGVIDRIGGGSDSLIRFPSGKMEWIPKTALRIAV